MNYQIDLLKSKKCLGNNNKSDIRSRAQRRHARFFNLPEKIPGIRFSPTFIDYEEGTGSDAVRVSYNKNNPISNLQFLQLKMIHRGSARQIIRLINGDMAVILMFCFTGLLIFYFRTGTPTYHEQLKRKNILYTEL